MPEEPFSNRELKEMFTAADERADAFHDKLIERMQIFEYDTRNSLSRIEIQTAKTNGRVTTIEKWQYTFMGGVGVLTFIVVPLLAWALYTLSNINDVVHRSVDEALSAYNITK